MKNNPVCCPPKKENVLKEMFFPERIRVNHIWVCKVPIRHGRSWGVREAEWTPLPTLRKLVKNGRFYTSS